MSVQHDQHRVPLVEALCDYRSKVQAPLHVPAHKQGRWASDEWRQLIGASALSIDLTEAPGLDDLHAPAGAIAQAQELAAAAFGAKRAFFLVGGTTAGLQALVLTACKPGEILAVPRYAHRSVIGAMILSGVRPAWMRFRLHDELDIPMQIEHNTLHAAIKEATAALLVYPTYFGVANGLAAQIQAIHQRGIPALVDEAHGAHFAFHPAMPPSALSMGADAVVQSTHKSGGSLTQSSLCLLGSDHRFDEANLCAMLQLVQTTSPSYLLMASLDMARRELALHGRAHWDLACELAGLLRRRLAALKGIRVHTWDDPTRVLIDVRGRHITGLQAASSLWAQGVAVELSGWGYVLAILSPGDTLQIVDRVVQAVSRLPFGAQLPPRPPEPPWPVPVVTPREAALAIGEPVALADAVGRIAAELVAPYPPGVPVVAPGELITAEVAAHMRLLAQAGDHLQGAADPTLATLRVMRE